jgi:oligopeptide transport system permease protein
MAITKWFFTKKDVLVDSCLEAESATLDLEKLPEEERQALFAPAEGKQVQDAAATVNGLSYWHSTFTSFRRNKTAMVMLGVLTVLLIFAMIQPLLPGQYGPNLVHNDPETGLQLMNCPPCKDFWLGTNRIGQDLWSRIWAGTRTSLFIGFSVAAIQCGIGMLVGLIWGYARRLDGLLTEIYNIMTNIPSTIIMMLSSYILRPGVGTIIIAMCATGWLGVARFVRNQVMIIRDLEFNRASRCLGSSFMGILFRNLLPHTVSVIALQFVLAIPAAIGGEVFLTYIGLGLQAEYPSLGNLINTGRMLIMSPSLRYQFYFPCIVLSVITVCFYIVGNAFADAANPKNHK